MTVRVEKPSVNLREKLAELDKPTGIAGEAMLRAETPQEQFNLIGAGRRNLIINGAMDIAQRGTSVTGVTTSTYGACDRWKIMEGSVAVLTLSQDTDAPDEFENCLKIVPTTADSSVSSSDYSVLNQTIEATNVKGAASGTSSSRPFSLSFWVKSNVTGTYCVELYVNSSTNVSAQYTINQAGVWEYKTVDYPPSQNAFGSANLSVQFWLLAGSNYSGGSSIKSTWSSGDNTRAVDQVNVLSSTSNYFQITGVQLEVGKVATPFEHRSYGEELALCQRYFEKWSGNKAMHPQYSSEAAGAYAAARELWNDFKVEKRANPSVTVTGTHSPSAVNASIYGLGAQASEASSTASVRISAWTADAEL